MKVYPAVITGVPGLVYVCIGTHERSGYLLCLAIQPDGSVVEAVVQRKDIET